MTKISKPGAQQVLKDLMFLIGVLKIENDKVRDGSLVNSVWCDSTEACLKRIANKFGLPLENLFNAKFIRK